jgi:hypothetical protein
MAAERSERLNPPAVETIEVGDRARSISRANECTLYLNQLSSSGLDWDGERLRDDEAG